MPNTKPSVQKKFEKDFASRVVGKEIRHVFYNDENCPVLSLSDGSLIFILSDDEGNGFGVPVHRNPDTFEETCLPQFGEEF